MSTSADPGSDQRIVISTAGVALMAIGHGSNQTHSNAANPPTGSPTSESGNSARGSPPLRNTTLTVNQGGTSQNVPKGGTGTAAKGAKLAIRKPMVGKQEGAGAPPARKENAALPAIYRSIGSPSAAAIAREDAGLLERAFDRLADDDREIIALCRIAGLPRTVVAEQVGKTVEAVRMQLSRALVRLGVALEQLGARPQ